MASLFEEKDRLVIPNWRNFKITSIFGELEAISLKPKSQTNTELSIQEYLTSWSGFKSIYTAGDLLSASFVNKLNNNINVKEAALFILDNRNVSSAPLISLAESFLNEESHLSENDLVQNEWMDIEQLNLLIKGFKNKINRSHFNPINYVELARLYSICGMKEKALKNMNVAIHLAPDNRFILRSAVRLYAHFHEIDSIYRIIKKSALVKIDPWITSSEISLAMAKGITPMSVKCGLRMIDSNDFSPYSLTELASSLGTLELYNGTQKKAKRLLKFALNAPNDNSLAQAKWIVNKHFLFPIDPQNYTVRNNFEALALDNFSNQNWKGTLVNCYNWFSDLPLSKGPVLLGSFVARNYLNDEKEARKLSFLGLLSHPNDALLLNNISYSFALENKIKEAELNIAKVRITEDTSQTTKICLVATKGLIAFRKGEIEKGRKLYLQAIEETNSINNQKLNWLAILNLTREEILNRTSNVKDYINLISKIPDSLDAPEINKLKSEVLEIYHKYHVEFG